jgi:hypothetical protein
MVISRDLIDSFTDSFICCHWHISRLEYFRITGVDKAFKDPAELREFKKVFEMVFTLLVYLCLLVQVEF